MQRRGSKLDICDGVKVPRTRKRRDRLPGLVCVVFVLLGSIYREIISRADVTRLYRTDVLEEVRNKMLFSPEKSEAKRS